MNNKERRASAIGFEAGWTSCEAYSEPEVATQVREAYQAGWSDACLDWRLQAADSSHPIGASHRYQKEGR